MKKTLTSIETIFTVNDCKKAGFYPRKKRVWRLKVDCTHSPPSQSYDSGWVWAKSFEKAVKLIKLYGLPSHMVLGVIHSEDRSMSAFIRAMVKWAIKTKQHMHGKPEIICCSSVHWLEQAKVRKELDLWLSKAYEN